MMHHALFRITDHRGAAVATRAITTAVTTGQCGRRYVYLWLRVDLMWLR